MTDTLLFCLENIVNTFKKALDFMLDMSDDKLKEALDKSLADCHVNGLFSMVVGGTENGRLTRIFYATKKIKPFDIQFHSHRYGLDIAVIDGCFTHHVASVGKFGHDEWKHVWLNGYTYNSPLNGGTGLQKSEKHTNWYALESQNIPCGGVLKLYHDNIHSVSCSKGTMWIVDEQGFDVDESVVLGVPFITDSLYNAPKQYQTNDVYQLVLEKLKLVVGEN